jgi:hypothetical protein
MPGEASESLLAPACPETTTGRRKKKIEAAAAPERRQ